MTTSAALPSNMNSDKTTDSDVLQGLTIETSPAPESDNSSSDEAELESYNIDTALMAWDQIGELSHEITSSLMAKQASMLCERFRSESAQPVWSSEPAAKKQKINAQISATNKHHISGVSPPSVVTSDEESSACCSSTFAESMSGNLSTQVDRIGRMSKLVLELEYCQQQLRAEMLAMSGDM